MKLKCTKGPLRLWSPVNQHLFTTADLRQVFDEQRQAFVALFVSAQSQVDSSQDLISPKERDANAHLFAHAAEMLQLLIDQEALWGQLSTSTYDEITASANEIVRRRAELLEKLKEAGVISEEGN